MTDENWKHGDAAMCIRDFSDLGDGKQVDWGPKTGAIYSVSDVSVDALGVVFLDFDEDPDHDPEYGWWASRFIKVTPPEADEFDREVIEHLTGAPVKKNA